MFKIRRTIGMYQYAQSVRILMAGSFKLTNEDWMQPKGRVNKPEK